VVTECETCCNIKKHPYSFTVLVFMCLSFVYVDVNTVGGSVHIIKKKSEALLVASKDIGLEVNSDKTKYMVMSRDQNAG